MRRTFSGDGLYFIAASTKEDKITGKMSHVAYMFVLQLRYRNNESQTPSYLKHYMMLNASLFGYN